MQPRAVEAMKPDRLRPGVALPMAGARDPVCGMTVDPSTAFQVVHGGTTYFFCGASCKRRFEQDPQTHLAQGPTGMAEETATSWKAYVPLIVVLAMIGLATATLALRDAAAGHFRLERTVSAFMAGFFLTFAGFKVLDLRGFAEGYQSYDLLARRLPAYAYLYPFIELGFGLAMLAGQDAPWLLVAEVIVMAFSGVGVVLKLLRREPFQCACLGTFLKVPLTKVTVIEDFGMAALALLLLLLQA